ncbi:MULTISPECIES: LysR family transcriptional regulator [Rhodobacterales]|uniref:Glycine cleavage system transcriptional activator n=1 Tax=Phaeobacter piscinae TaxID=1580596 RepID=A0ABM6PJN8_9RHOB|nr:MULTISPECIES: LysR family transcriptional regulator [Rhodobacterales]ATG38021.1 putative glycine cleavage system transcriptional activator [Phaeobacter piscinae]AUQ88542.1 putative glycine cleavage system transcriptional activator [Phaeobacter piscinae]
MPMDRPNIPLNALRSFEAAARQGSFTNAAVELCVTQAAVSHQILRLEDQLGAKLFHRTSKGLLLTPEGEALLPVLTASLDRISGVLDRFTDGRYHETLNVGVVTTFAVGWLTEYLKEFETSHPGISVRFFTNNNRVDIAREGLDLAIRFGAGRWPGLTAQPLMETPLTPMCAPSVALALKDPEALLNHKLLRSYRADEWPIWFREAGMGAPHLEGPIYDSSVAMAELAARGVGVALLPYAMFQALVSEGRLVRPFDTEVTTGRYWITRLSNKEPTTAVAAFEAWICKTAL